MKLTKKIVSLILVLIIGLSVCVPSGAASSDIQSSRPQFFSISQYQNKLMEEGYPTFTTDDFMKIYDAMGAVVRLFTGRFLYAEEHFDVTVDEYVTAACNHVYENSGLDVVKILTSLPDVNNLPDLTTTLFKIDTAEFREQMYDKRDEAWEDGDEFMSSVYFFLGAYMSVIQKCYVTAVPTENADVVEVVLLLTYKDGAQEQLRPGIYINSVTGECSNKEIDGTGLVNTGFNMNLSEMMVYATINGWMRNYGFCLFYDFMVAMSPLLWNYDTLRFKFDYDGLEWMIQIWKGNYLITNGGEVGLYNREPGSFGSYYDCATDDQLLEMSLQIWHGDDLLVNQEPQMHWWINGFHMSKRMYIPESLKMCFSIVMPDEEMLNAFCESMDKHYKKAVTYTVEGLKVNVVW